MSYCYYWHQTAADTLLSQVVNYCALILTNHTRVSQLTLSSSCSASSRLHHLMVSLSANKRHTHTDRRMCVCVFFRSQWKENSHVEAQVTAGEENEKCHFMQMKQRKDKKIVEVTGWWSEWKLLKWAHKWGSFYNVIKYLQGAHAQYVCVLCVCVCVQWLCFGECLTCWER